LRFTGWVASLELVPVAASGGAVVAIGAAPVGEG